VQFVFAFSLIAGLAVLYAALESTHDEREYEIAVLRTLGARNRQLRAALAAEFAALGAIAGVVAGVGCGHHQLAARPFRLPDALRAGLAGAAGGRAWRHPRHHAGRAGGHRAHPARPALQSLRALA
jgi:putative ABC transport system permease protein